MSNFNPDLFMIISVRLLFLASVSQISWPLLHCQTIALQSGLPVSLSKITKVSLWLVIEIKSGDVLREGLISFIRPRRLLYISLASCSMYPS